MTEKILPSPKIINLCKGYFKSVSVHFLDKN